MSISQYGVFSMHVISYYTYRFMNLIEQQQVLFFCRCFPCMFLNFFPLCLWFGFTLRGVEKFVFTVIVFVLFPRVVLCCVVWLLIMYTLPTIFH